MKISIFSFALRLITSSFNIFATLPGYRSIGKEIGLVSVSGIRGDIDDVINALQMKGCELGGHSIKIISLDSPWDSDTYLGTAEVISR